MPKPSKPALPKCPFCDQRMDLEFGEFPPHRNRYNTGGCQGTHTKPVAEAPSPFSQPLTAAIEQGKALYWEYRSEFRLIAITGFHENGSNITRCVYKTATAANAIHMAHKVWQAGAQQDLDEFHSDRWSRKFNAWTEAHQALLQQIENQNPPLPATNQPLDKTSTDRESPMTAIATQPMLALVLPAARPSALVLAQANADVTGAVQRYTLDHIIHNRFQTRDADDDEIPSLAESIELNGLISPPVGRIDPDDPTGQRIELANGHRRLAAHAYLHQKFVTEFSDRPSPWFEMPVDIRPLSNLQMFRYCIAENKDRRPLSAIEKAKALHRATTELGLTQKEAGEEFGIGQSAVSNLLSLLNLPTEAQSLVSDRAVPERHARQMVAMAEVAPTIVNAVLARVAESDNKDEAMEDELDEQLRKNAVCIANGYGTGAVVFALDAEIGVDPDLVADAKAEKLPIPLPACAGCQFAHKRQNATWCVRPACARLKHRSVLAAQVRGVGAKLGIAVVINPDGLTPVVDQFNGRNHAYRAWLEDAIGNKKARNLLRLSPYADEKFLFGTFEYMNQQVLDNKYAVVYTTDLAALLKVAPLATAKDEEAERERQRAEQQEEERQAKARRQRNAELMHLAAQVFAQKVIERTPGLADLFSAALWDFMVYDMETHLNPSDFPDGVVTDEGDFFELDPAVRGRACAHFLLVASVDDRLDDGETHEYGNTKAVATAIHNTLRDLDLHVPAQITQAAQVKPEPKPSTKKAKPAKKAAPKAKAVQRK